jgi:hypothetical protein
VSRTAEAFVSLSLHREGTNDLRYGDN